ncbi:MAG: hypothetical protein R2847_07565 [Bacteroidia bacterium]
MPIKEMAGEVLGLKRLNAIEVKADFETKFVNWTKNVKDGQDICKCLNTTQRTASKNQTLQCCSGLLLLKELKELTF